MFKRKRYEIWLCPMGTNISLFSTSNLHLGNDYVLANLL